MKPRWRVALTGVCFIEHHYGKINAGGGPARAESLFLTTTVRVYAIGHCPTGAYPLPEISRHVETYSRDVAETS